MSESEPPPNPEQQFDSRWNDQPGMSQEHPESYDQLHLSAADHANFLSQSASEDPQRDISQVDGHDVYFASEHIEPDHAHDIPLYAPQPSVRYDVDLVNIATPDNTTDYLPFVHYTAVYPSNPHAHHSNHPPDSSNADLNPSNAYGHVAAMEYTALFQNTDRRINYDGDTSNSGHPSAPTAPFAGEHCVTTSTKLTRSRDGKERRTKKQKTDDGEFSTGKGKTKAHLSHSLVGRARASQTNVSLIESGILPGTPSASSSSMLSGSEEYYPWLQSEQYMLLRATTLDLYKQYILTKWAFPEEEGAGRHVALCTKAWNEAASSLNVSHMAYMDLSIPLSAGVRPWRQLLLKAVETLVIPIYLSRYQNPAVRQQVVKTLIDDRNFIYRTIVIDNNGFLLKTSKNGPPRDAKLGSFEHPGIQAAITSIVFGGGALAPAVFRPDAFQPIPLETIAFAMVAINMALKKELDDPEKPDLVAANNDWVYYLSDLRQFQASDHQLCSEIQQTLWDVGSRSPGVDVSLSRTGNPYAEVLSEDVKREIADLEREMNRGIPEASTSMSESV